MATQVVFNMDPKVKARAMKRAKAQGIPFSSVLNFAAKAFADGDFSVGMVAEIRPEKMKLLEREARASDAGKGRRFASAREAAEYLLSM